MSFNWFKFLDNLFHIFGLTENNAKTVCNGPKGNDYKAIYNPSYISLARDWSEYYSPAKTLVKWNGRKLLRFPVRLDKGNENSGNEIGLLRIVRLGHVIEINLIAKVCEKAVQELGRDWALI